MEYYSLSQLMGACALLLLFLVLVVLSGALYNKSGMNYNKSGMVDLLNVSGFNAEGVLSYDGVIKFISNKIIK